MLQSYTGQLIQDSSLEHKQLPEPSDTAAGFLKEMLHGTAFKSDFCNYLQESRKKHFCP